LFSSSLLFFIFDIIRTSFTVKKKFGKKNHFFNPNKTLKSQLQTKLFQNPILYIVLFSLHRCLYISPPKAHILLTFDFQNKVVITYLGLIIFVIIKSKPETIGIKS